MESSTYWDIMDNLVIPEKIVMLCLIQLKWIFTRNNSEKTIHKTLQQMKKALDMRMPLGHQQAQVLVGCTLKNQ